MTLTFTVPGDPITQGSMRAFARGGRAIVTHDKGPALNHWRSRVTLEARRAWGRAAPLDGPVAVTLTFRLARPKSHYGTGRNAQRLKPSAPALPHTGLDLDKLARAINDALTQARVWADDSRVCSMTTHKVYAGPGEMAGVDVTVEPLTVPSQRQHDVIGQSLAA
ncbi:RusA family crossover junction endodeoxyribonuclease [Galactobacter valiniphilus]|uniref:RusA family crossover junction endodeoxyribonuclease n=1 Tax=Galactobacter valiniphilus TaxID=2676122 RepID=A0A399J8K0_9MICC|nr:RusA family crossover junction endodeoxyribonuclease [Galactobacter valiniphilus]RII41901.1 RusA family crossover junction endodeoxyribonuclease [Galactobacter valiniphilus]